jgi:hypothetical protein
VTRTCSALVVLLITGLIGLCAATARADVIQTFSVGAADFQAWTVNNGGSLHMDLPSWTATGGNGGGYISAEIGHTGNRLYGLQPATTAAYGDITNMLLTADTLLQGEVNDPSGYQVRFYVGSRTGGMNYFVSSDVYSWSPNADTNWNRHQVALLAQNFVRWPNDDANNKTFAQVLSHPDDIGLVFTGRASEFGNNAELGFSSKHGATYSLDNFGVMKGAVPEPATMVLLAAGGIGLLIRRPK